MVSTTRRLKKKIDSVASEQPHWTVRFMPDQIGTWCYEAKFSDGTPGARGTFTCTPSDIPGLVATDPVNPVWFGFRLPRKAKADAVDEPKKPASAATHRQFRSLHIGDRFFASNWPEADRKAFLDWAESQGYNMLSVASHYLNRDAETRGRGWDTPDLWDDTAHAPRPEEFDRLELMLDELARRGFVIFPFAGFFGQSSDFPTDPADQRLYLEYTIARLGPYWNMVFNVAGPEPLIKQKEFRNAMSEADIDRLARLIKAIDPYGHMLTVHNPTASYTFNEAPWCDYATLQGFKNYNYTDVYHGLLKAHNGRRPVYAQEVFWPGNKYAKNDYNDDDLRKKAFTLLMAATTINYGDMNGNSSSGFSGTLNLDERVQKRHDIIHRAWDFFDSIPYYKMKPCPELVEGGFCLADDTESPSRVLIYLPDGEPVRLKFPLTSHRATWIRPDAPDNRIPAACPDNRLPIAPPEVADRGENADWLLMIKINP